MVKGKFRCDLPLWSCTINSWVLSACRTVFFSLSEVIMTLLWVLVRDLTPPHKRCLRGQNPVFYRQEASFQGTSFLMGFVNILSFSGFGIPNHIYRGSHSWELSSRDVNSILIFKMRVFYVNAFKERASCMGESARRSSVTNKAKTLSALHT